MWDTLVDFVFHANGAAGGAMPVQTVDWEDGDAVLDALGFTWEGHSFLGWNTEPDGSGTSYADRATFAQDYLSGLLPAEVNLYAQWEAGPGSLAISKVVSGAMAGGPSGEQEFRFELTVDGKPYSGPYTVGAEQRTAANGRRLCSRAARPRSLRAWTTDALTRWPRSTCLPAGR